MRGGKEGARSQPCLHGEPQHAEVSPAAPCAPQFRFLVYFVGQRQPRRCCPAAFPSVGALGEATPFPASLTPAQSQGEARPANNQESKEPPARHGEPLPGRLQPLPALAAEPPSAAHGGGSRAAPHNPVKRCPRHPSSHEQDPDGW